MAPSPVAVVCVGMAGSGKTTFMQRINSHLHARGDPPYVMNLDPAVRSVPFETNIDIRDSINYKEVMSQYNLGPNGGILTSLNLFATKVDQVLAILEKRCGAPYSTPSEASSTANPTADTATESSGKSQSKSQSEPTTTPTTTDPTNNTDEISHILLDTPGQIEVFVWSASGQILLSSLASTYPTVLAYIIDTPRTASTSTFMSNMLYACSILYKTKLPMILVFNKTDAQSADFAKEWMTDFEAFQAALKREEETGRFGGVEDGGAQAGGGPAVGGSGYMGSLLNSMSLVLEEFYKHLSVVGVSSMTGAGIDEFFEAVDEKAEEFERDYRPELERRRNAREEEKKGKREMDLGRLMRDLDVEGEGEGGAQAGSARRRGRPEPETISDLEDESSGEDDERDGDGDDQQNDALRKRYQQTQGPGGVSSDDMSFARYIQSSQR